MKSDSESFDIGVSHCVVHEELKLVLLLEASEDLVEEASLARAWVAA